MMEKDKTDTLPAGVEQDLAAHDLNRFPETWQAERATAFTKVQERGQQSHRNRMSGSCSSFPLPSVRSIAENPCRS
jgi:hypothetical protein